MEGGISFTKNILNISIQSVILFGLGLGAIPSLYVVSTNKQNAEDIKGIILYSPYLNENLLEDIEISNVECPVFFMNGKKNKSSNYAKIQSFTQYFKLITEWYPKKGTYDNLHTSLRKKFYLKIKHFISTLFNLPSSTNVVPKHTFTIKAVNGLDIKDNYCDNKTKSICQEPIVDNNIILTGDNGSSTKEDDNNTDNVKRDSNHFSIMRYSEFKIECHE